MKRNRTRNQKACDTAYQRKQRETELGKLTTRLGALRAYYRKTGSAQTVEKIRELEVERAALRAALGLAAIEVVPLDPPQTPTVKACKACKKEFRVVKSSQVTCGPACRRAWGAIRRQRNLAKKRVPREPALEPRGKPAAVGPENDDEVQERIRKERARIFKTPKPAAPPEPGTTMLQAICRRYLDEWQAMRG